MKKKLLFEALWNEKWAGGLYYIRNILFSLSLNEYIVENYSFIVHSFIGNESVFEDFCNVKKIYTKTRGKHIDKLSKLLVRFFVNSDFVFPLTEKRTKMDTKSIAWIPDFQHKHFPQYFSPEILRYRDKKFRSYINDKCSIVFSSNDSLMDFNKFYSGTKKETYVVPFVSFIEPILKNITQEKEKKILEKYGLLEKKYTCIMNQFWQHKNHKIVFEAMSKLFMAYPDCDMQFVMTGRVEDYRNPSYIESIMEIMKREEISTHTTHLGFISREEQIVIMKNAVFVIQPSLFEGWGTVVEDAKVLDKTILLSDIPVHREQMNSKCILFDPYNATELAQLIFQESQIEHNDDTQKGIADMYKRAKEYSKGFEQLIKDMETRK